MKKKYRLRRELNADYPVYANYHTFEEWQGILQDYLRTKYHGHEAGFIKWMQENLPLFLEEVET